MCRPLTRFDPNDFTHPTRIDNRYLPLVPGARLVYQGTAEGEAHRVVFTVTDLTKVIDGVRAVVIWDQDFSAGELVESELAFFAQDDEGNVWNLGEYPEEYESGKLVGAPSTWITGLRGAEAGLHMLARPREGTPSYLQGRALNIEFLDCARVYRTGRAAAVPAGRFSNVLVTNEWSPLEPDSGIQRKFYAPHVGMVKVTAIGDPEGEFLDLVRVVQLGPQGLAEVRAEALKMDRRGCRLSAVYCRTEPAR
ncbi:MAG: hypothetical protein IRY97_11795 [Thermomicrobiaceae bacterium]|nr:hypothetical protein [Thermomicrobiaceae bacterium]